MLGTKTRLDTLVLSEGQTWVAVFFPRGGAKFPAGTTCECIITDPAGGVLATWEASSITETRIDFFVGTDECDPIPHGSYYRVVAHYPASGGVFPGDTTFPGSTTYPGSFTIPPIDENLSRGSVVRDDNPTPLAAPRSSNISLSFFDDMSGPGVDPNWVKVKGQLKIYGNGPSLPNGMSADFTFFDVAAARYRAQTNKDAVKVEVSTVLGDFSGDGKSTVIVCSNQAMTSWVGFQQQTGSSPNRKMRIIKGSGPSNYVELAAVANTSVNNDRYTCIYDPLADNYLVYKGTDFSTPLVQWQDVGHEIPHGNGYRYPALLFQSGLLSTGIKLSGWAIKDN